MPRYSTLKLVQNAVEGNYAVPAINIIDPLSLRAVIDAANKIGTPLIVQTSVKTVRLFGAKTLASAFEEAMVGITVPVTLHLDHCPDRKVVTEAIAAGWNSVLFDASDRDFDQAVAETREVVAEAHAANVEVESEIENIVGIEDGVGSDSATHAYSVETLVGAATDCGVDLLAPALGTSHGVYHAQPVLLPERAAEIVAQTDIPIVLHGGTGLSNQEFQAFIDAGVGKINVSTALKHAYMKSSLAFLRDVAEAEDKWEPVQLFDAQVTASQEIVKEFATIFGSIGKA